MAKILDYKVAEQLKNIYTKNYIKNLAFKIKDEYKIFDEEDFVNAIFDNTWEELELKNRMRHIALTLHIFLPLSYIEQINILKEVSKDFTSYEAMFFQDFVEVFGLDYFDESMDALSVFTIGSSSEFAIRQFILKYEDKTMNQLKLWAKDENEHLRRLASEGCRPRLPWAIALTKFKKDPKKIFEIIELLKYDKSKYVQKSIANNLNDISKDNPLLVVDFVKKNLGINENLDWVCKHASRSLLKKGDKIILSFFGFDKKTNIKIENFNTSSFVKKGDYLDFSFTLQSVEDIGKLRLEYIIYYLKSNGIHNKKIFMISQNEIKSNSKTYKKRQIFKDMTTRKHYLGKHYLSLVINGEEKIKKEFILK